MEKPAVGSQGKQGLTTPSTTFVQADSNTFRELVQRLTGPSDASSNVPPPPHHHQSVNHVADGLAATKPGMGIKRPSFKLHERRQYTPRSKLEIVRPPCSPFMIGSRTPSPGSNNSSTRRNSHKISPSSASSNPTAGFSIGSPSNTFSNLSIYEEQQRKILTSSADLNNNEEEEKAIKERRFYLHRPLTLSPSSRSSRSSNSEPELLTLFPLTSPKSPEL